ncbi:hypothetical protein BVIR_2048 [Blastochloris viridis]|uniref:Uncharacterized protein n=1 Tax=Blastochloris viridis TaxID=1079 RepID=A0A182D4J0_BLAVI|nr:hypothetical protein BVIR_2048 [Blastochloris viridis]BAS00279.1 hypothetical protein BV133_2685 [Blastochloris viridis]
MCLFAGVLVLTATGTLQGSGGVLSGPIDSVAASDRLTQPTLPTRDGVRITATEIRWAAMCADLASPLGGTPAALAFDSRPLPAFGPARTTTFQTLFAIVSAASATVFDARAPPAAG